MISIMKTSRPLSYWVAQAMVVAVLILMSRADWVLSSLYHDAQTPSGIGLAVIALFIVVLLVVVPLALLLPTKLSEPALRVLTVAVAIYILAPAIRALPLFPAELGPTHKIGLVLSTLLLTWLAVTKLSSAQWPRLQLALIVGGLLFVSTPMLAVKAIDPIHLRVPAGMSPQRATVVLLLDELNAEAGEQIAAAITQAGGAPRTHRIKAVGTSTITVIPEMFGGPHVPQARVCTTTAVCDPAGIFDFSRLHFDPADRFHIVGFHHPYCAANGLASCVRLASTSSPPVTSLLCSFMRLLPVRPATVCEWSVPDDWESFRNGVRAAALNSPFWNSGGTLYAHLPFPHPPGNQPGGDLLADYKDNLGLAGHIAAQVWRKGYERFGNDFRLIVISDHPLRQALWCKHGKYRETGCNLTPTAFEGQVPYIISGGDAHLFNPTSSRGTP
jgi:hypothetical protein